MSGFSESLMQKNKSQEKSSKQYKEEEFEEQERNQGRIIEQDSKLLYFFTGDGLMKIDKRKNEDDSKWELVKQTSEVVYFITEQGNKIAINRKEGFIKQEEVEIPRNKESIEIEEVMKWYEKPITKIEPSAQHIHLSQKTFEALFGEGAVKEWMKSLSQPGQYALKEKVILVNEKKGKSVEISVTILGPFRKYDQVEISKTLARQLGIKTMRRDSGDLEGTPGITLKVINKKIENGEEIEEIKEVEIDKGVIEAKTHLHLSEEEAGEYKIINGQEVLIKIAGEDGKIKAIVPISVKVDKNFREALHMDTDQWNAFDLEAGDAAFVLKQ